MGKDMAELTQATAAVLHEKDGAFRLEGVTIGPLRGDEVLVRIVAAGICHTDLNVRQQVPPLPVVLGHEGSGIVEAVGDGVTAVRAGDAVVLTYLSCGDCRECRAGLPASCAQLGRLCFANARPDGSHALCGQDGRVLGDRFFGQSSFATYAVANERNVVVVPKDAPLELLGPLGCGIMTGAGAVWNELEVQPGSGLAVFGAGAVGQSAILAAKVAGAATIIAVDRVAARLELALELGATHAINASEVADIAAQIRQITGDGVDYALDTTGVASVVEQAFTALRQRGTLGLVACLDRAGVLSFSQFAILGGCKGIIGIIEGGGSAQATIPRIISLYQAGQFPFDRLVRFYDFDQINQAVYDCESGEAVKPILRMGQ